MRGLLGIRDARLYIGGQGLSMLGDCAMWLAMGIWVKQLTGSSAAAGLTAVAYMGPQLAGPAAGLLADRVRRRPLLLTINVASALIVLPLLLVHSRGDVWVIYTVMVLYGASNALLSAAQPGLLKTVVPARLLPEANGALQTLREGVRLVAPLAGAGLFAAVGPAAVVALDATTFLLAAIALASMRIRESVPEPSRTSVADATAGLRHIWSTPVLRRLMVASLISIVGFGFAETALYAVVDVGLHRPPTFLGALMAVQGAAAVVAGIVAASLLRRIGEPRLCATGLALFALGCLLLAMPSLPAVLLGYVLLGTGIPWAVVAEATLLQRMTGRAMQGRVVGALGMVTAVPHAASIAGGAILIATLDYRIVLGAMAALLLAGAVEIARAREPGSRTPPRRPDSSREERVEVSKPVAAGKVGVAWTSPSTRVTSASRMHLKASAIACLVLGLTSACGSDEHKGVPASRSGAPRLSVTVWPHGRPGTSETEVVSCRGASTSRRHDRLCRQLGDLDPRIWRPATGGCTAITFGPAVARVVGTIEGADVDARFSLSNGCEISRWKQVQALIGDPSPRAGQADPSNLHPPRF